MRTALWQVCDSARDSLKISIAQSDLDRTFQNIHDFVFVAINVKPIAAFGLKIKPKKVICTASMRSCKLVRNA